ncbi:hypothetical protein GCM10009579_13700 [Streptomyces javensis]|uniref:Uncharacterized protein n=1 Tax=Streptomyces javensis TaxID=114698 RepID=A0ABP4HED2_9ACTN
MDCITLGGKELTGERGYGGRWSTLTHGPGPGANAVDPARGRGPLSRGGTDARRAPQVR